MDSGFGGGEDEMYNVYDKAWRSEKNIGQSIYRPTKNADKDIYGDDFDEIIRTNRFVPDKGFEGADRVSRRDGPVQFQKHGDVGASDEKEADPFGLDKFLGEAKKGAKRNDDERRKGSPDRGRDRDYDRKKRRGS